MCGWRGKSRFMAAAPVGRGPLSPTWAQPYDSIAKIEYQRSRFAQVLEALEQYSKIIDDNPSARLMMSHIQATATDDKLRNGKAAVENAKKACEITGYKQFPALEALAAAYAEAGNFDEAVNWANKALELAPGMKKGMCQSEIELYKSKKPLRMRSAP